MKKILFACLSAFLLFACQQNDKNLSATHSIDTPAIESSYHTASLVPNIYVNKKKPATEIQELWLETLITETPQEGRELAMKMARKTIAAIQTDPEVRKKLRDDYAEDTKQLIHTAEVVALEFQTVAQANNYWRKD